MPVFRPGGGGMGIFGRGVGPVGNGGHTIVKIEKIFNCVIYDRFINEFKRMLKKYPLKQTKEIMKHLFHGSNATDPKLIYESELGFDQRFAN